MSGRKVGEKRLELGIVEDSVLIVLHSGREHGSEIFTACYHEVSSSLLGCFGRSPGPGAISPSEDNVSAPR